MSSSRSTVIVLILIGVVSAFAGLLGNIAAGALPVEWQPYLWLAWPLFILFTAAGIGLALWQARRDPPASPAAPSPTERAVLASRRTLLVLTPAYLASAWTEFEALLLQTLDPANRQRRLITERSGYVLQGADVRLFLAQLSLNAGDRAAALEHARLARQLAMCDGPPDYTYKVAYEEAGALVGRLEGWRNGGIPQRMKSSE